MTGMLVPGAIIAFIAALGVRSLYQVADLEEAQAILVSTVAQMADRMDVAAVRELIATGDPASAEALAGELQRRRRVIVDAVDGIFSEHEEPVADRTLVDVRLIAATDDPAVGRVIHSQRPQRIGTTVDLTANWGLANVRAGVTVEHASKADGELRTLSAYAPIRDADGRMIAFVALDADQAYFAGVGVEAIAVAVVVFAVYALLALPPAWLLSRRLARPVARLREGMDAVGGGDLSIDLEPVRDADFNALIERFNAMVGGLREHAALRADVAAAAEIQSRLLPTTVPQIDGYEVAARLRYCQATGGDAYDFLEHEGRQVLLLGDVTGHGVASALMMCGGLAALRTACRRPGTDLSPVLAAVNEQLREETPPGAFMTLFAASLDPVTHRLDWWNAGNGPALRLRGTDGTVERLESTDVPLGIIADRPFAAGTTVTMDPGDTLVVITDGLHEARNAQGGLLGLDAVAERLRSLAGSSAETMVTALEDLGRRHSGRTTPEDDVTIMILRRRAVGEPNARPADGQLPG
jgi:serine phosphatase RsbU (regulator of sigma subunit)